MTTEDLLQALYTNRLITQAEYFPLLHKSFAVKPLP